MARDRGRSNDYGVVAAAQRIDLSNRIAAHRAAAVAQPWQAEAWEAYNEVPEIGESLQYRGDLMAQLVLFPAVPDPDNPDGDPIPLADERAAAPPGVIEAADAELARLRTSSGGQAEILRLYEINMQVAGELYLVGFAETADEEEYWQVCSTQEVKEQDGEFTVLAKPGDTEGRKLTADDYIDRYWTRHPQWASLPDSPLRRLRTDSRAAIILNEQVITEALSTLPAGMLLIPNEITFGWPAGYTPSDAEAARDPFDVMLERAVQDGMVPGSFASQYPMVVRGPGEQLERMRRLSLARESDTTTEARLSARVERIARGLPLPVEKVMGHQQTTFANAAQVDRDEFDDYLRPAAVSMVTALTYCFYRPHLEDNPGVPDDWAERIVLWFDPQALIADPDPAESADFGVTEGLIKASSWREAKGYTEEDAPDPAELLARLAYRRGTVDAGLAAQLLRDLAAEAGIELSAAEQQTIAEATPEQAAAIVIRWHMARTRGQPPPHLTPRPPLALTAGAGTAPQIIEDAGHELVRIDQELRTRWRAVMDAALDRELERTANKLRNVARRLGITAAVTAAPADVAPLLGRAAVTAAEVTYDWSRLKLSFMGLGRRAQDQALEAAGRIAGGFSPAQRQTLGLRQADDLDKAWQWTQGAMTSLADAGLYDPKLGQYSGLGELDPTSRIPAGMVREAMNVAGGSPAKVLTDETVRNGEAWINIGATPVGGVGVGPRIRDALASEGVGVVAYRWVYGPALRMAPFEPHQRLDGTQFESFDDPVLANTTGWPARSHYLPGDHAGCVCDVEPILGAPPPPPAPTPEPLPPSAVFGKETGKPVRGFDSKEEEQFARQFAGWRRTRSLNRPSLDVYLDAKVKITETLDFLGQEHTVANAAAAAKKRGWAFKEVKLSKTRARALLTTPPEDMIPELHDDLLRRAAQEGHTAQKIVDDGLVIIGKVGDDEVVLSGGQYLWAALERGALTDEAFPKVLYYTRAFDVPEGADLARRYHPDDLSRVRQAATRELKKAKALLPPPVATTPISDLAPLARAEDPKATARQFDARWGPGGEGGTNIAIRDQARGGVFAGMSPRVANDVADELDKQLRAHPNTASKIRGFFTEELGDNTNADASQYTRHIRFNSSWYNERRLQEGWEPTSDELAADRYQNELDSWRHRRGGWSPMIDDPTRTITDARYTTAHEFGHHIDYTARAALGEHKWNQIVQDEIEAHWREVNGGPTTDRITGRARKLARITKAGDGANQSRQKLPYEMARHVTEHLSQYATTNLREVMAEVVAEATLSASPRPLALRIYRLLMKAAENIDIPA